ncbi:MAG: hypothetical protein SGBAC_005498 [Bacillariaceae sp.]
MLRFTFTIPKYLLLLKAWLLVACISSSFHNNNNNNNNSLFFASAAFTSVSLTGGSLAGATLEHQINLGDTNANANGQDTITIRYTSPQTGWLAVGLGTGMVNGEVVIGKPDDNNSVKKYRMTAKSGSAISELPNQTLINASLQQTGGTTILTFTKLLVEDGEYTITAGASNSFIAAFGSSNTFAVHSGYGVQAVTLDAGGSAPTTPAPTVASIAPVPTNPPTTAAPFNAPTNLPGFETLQLTGELQGSTLSYRFTVEDPNAGGKDSITVTYTAPVSNVWVGVGFSTAGLMVGSEAVIGIPASTGDDVKKYSLGGKTTAGVTLLPDSQQTLVDASLTTTTTTTTTLTFTKILVEDGEIAINRVGETILLAAHGASGTLGIHATSGSFTLSGNVIERDNTLWVVHGCLAYVAWGVLCPMAILAGLLRKYIPGQGMWYQIHRTLQSLAVLLTIMSVVVAIAALNQETPDTASAGHFSPDFAEGHRTIGLVILVLAILQGGGGLLRPHLAQKPESNSSGNSNNDSNSSSEGGNKSTMRKVWEVLHRLLGLCLLMLTWYQIDLGIQWYHEIFDNGDVEPTNSIFLSAMGIFGFLILMAMALKVMMS